MDDRGSVDDKGKVDDRGRFMSVTALLLGGGGRFMSVQWCTFFTASSVAFRSKKFKASIMSSVS